TNTRYLLGVTSLVGRLNEQLRQAGCSADVVECFDLVAKPGVFRATQLDQVTAIDSPNGAYSLLEFGEALPRAKLYSQWEVNTNADGMLQRISDPAFNPQDTVLVGTGLPSGASPATNHGEGSVEFAGYSPKDIQLNSDAPTATVLLLNDRYDPDWKVL